MAALYEVLEDYDETDDRVCVRTANDLMMADDHNKDFLYSSMIHHTTRVLYCTVLHCTALHCTVL